MTAEKSFYDTKSVELTPNVHQSTLGEEIKDETVTGVTQSSAQDVLDMQRMGRKQ